jgi:hypothetical protein
MGTKAEAPSVDVLRIVHAFGDKGRKDEVRALAASVRATEDELAQAKLILSHVSGALCDSGVTVYDSTADGYGRSIRELTAERDALRKVAEEAEARKIADRLADALERGDWRASHE